MVVLPAGRYTVEGPTPDAAVVVESSAGEGAASAAAHRSGRVTFSIHPGTWHFRPE